MGSNQYLVRKYQQFYTDIFCLSKYNVLRYNGDSAKNVSVTLTGGTPVKISGIYVREYINHITARDLGLGCLWT